MKLRRNVVGSRCLAVLFVLGSIAALGCSGDRVHDDDDDDDTGGSSGAGGFGGSGGTTSGSSSCLNVCENLQACPNSEPIDCAESCRLSATQPCAREAELMFRCLEGLDVCTDPGTECLDELDALEVCQGGSGTGNCPYTGAPSNASCSSICARDATCPNATPDCVPGCEETNATATAMGCSSEVQAVMGCLGTCIDACTLTEQDCVDQLDLLVDCEIAYCTANPSATICL